MKKAVIAIIVCLLLCFSFSMMGCNNTPDPDPGPGPGPGPVDPIEGYDGDPSFKEDGETQGAATAKTYTATRTDNRVAVYKAYTKTGTQIGTYKSLANAANAAINKDVADSTFGAYVLKEGSTVKMFVNHEGYDKAGQNDETYWMYENGLSLDNYWCWDDADTLGTLRDSKLTTLGTSGYGTKAVQNYQSFSSYDKGGEIAANAFAPWKFTRPMDAAVYTFPIVYSGMTKLEYEIDLSDVRIYPSYTTGDEASTTYAFMGIYIWQDYYVVNMGIACDTKTGNWYPYSGTARDDSSSDTVYTNSGCVMTSTWNDAGYFVPDKSSVTVTAETKLLEDDFGEFQVVDVAFDVEGGSTYSRRLTDANLNNWFSSPAAMSMENSFVFIAGLDVVNGISASPLTPNVDQFNGAAFENLKITSARAYVPTAAELSDVQYGSAPHATRGQWHDMLWSNASGAGQVFEHSITYNNHATTYTKGTGVDTFSFSFNKYETLNAATAPVHSANAKEFQDSIDFVATLTEETIGAYIDDMLAIEGWYIDGTRDADGRTIHEKYFNVLDFSGYLAADIVLKQWASLTEELQDFVDVFMDIAPLNKDYELKGWKSVGGGEAGYLYDAYEVLAPLVEDFDEFTELEQEKVLVKIGITRFENWYNFVKMVAAAEAHDNYSDAGFMTYSHSGHDLTDKNIAVTAATAFERLVTEIIALRAQTKITDNFDNTFPIASRFLVTYDYMINLELIDGSAPNYFYSCLMWLDGGKEFYDSATAFGNIIRIGSLWQTQDVTGRARHDITAEQAAILSKVFTANWEYTNGGIRWNINSHYFAANPFAYIEQGARGNILVEHYLTAGTSYTKAVECYRKVVDVLERHGYENGAPTNPAVTPTSNPWKVTATTISAHEGFVANLEDLTENGETLYNILAAVGRTGTFAYTGYKAPAETPFNGYLFDTAKKVKDYDFATAWAGLNATDKEIILISLDVTEEQLNNILADWKELYDELVAIEAIPEFTSATPLTTYGTTGNGYGLGAAITSTPAQALDHLFRQMYSMTIFNQDDTPQASQRVFVTIEYLKSIGITPPAAMMSKFNSITGFTGYYKDFIAFGAIVSAGTAWKIEMNADPTITAPTITQEQAAALSIYFTNDWAFNDGGVKWNFNHFLAQPTPSFGDNEKSNKNGVMYAYYSGGKNEFNSLKECFEFVQQMLVRHGYTAVSTFGNGNAHRVAEAAIEAKTVKKVTDNLSEGGVTFFNEWVRFGDIRRYSDVKGIIDGDGKAFVQGYLYNMAYQVDELDLQTIWTGLVEGDKTTIAGYYGTDIAGITGMLAGWHDFLTEMDALLADADYIAATEYTIQELAHNSTSTQDLTAAELLNDIAIWGYAILNGGAWEGSASYKMDTDNSWYQSVYIVNAVKLFEEVGLELPTAIEEMLSSIGYDVFEEAYDALAFNVALGEAIATKNYTSTADITDDELAGLNVYWVNSYALKLYGWHWNSDNKFANYMANRVAKVVSIEATGENKLFKEYVASVATLLSASGYPLNDNGWGVKVATISKTGLPVEVANYLALIDSVPTSLEVAFSDTAKAINWMSGDGSAPANGYVYNTAKNANRLITDWAALSSDHKQMIADTRSLSVETIAEILTTRANSWTPLKNELDALDLLPAYTAATTYPIYDTGSNVATTVLKNLTAAELLGEVAVWAHKVLIGTKWEGSGNVMDGDNSWFQSVHIVNAVQILDGLGITMPTAIQNMLTAIGYDSFEEGYNSLVFNVSLAKSILDNDHKTLSDLTVDELAGLNIYWVNSYALNGSFAWNWNNGNKCEQYMGHRMAKVVKVVTGANEKKMFEYVAVIADFMTANSYTVKANGWGVTADTIAA